MTDCFLPQLTFSFYSKSIRADFSGGQITSDAGLLLLRGFDQRHRLTSELARRLADPRDPERVEHSLLALLRQRLYGICAGYEDANDAQRLRHDPILQLVTDRPLGEALGSQPTLSRVENAVSAREVARLNDLLLDWFVGVCGESVRQRGEILLDLDSTDDPTHGQQQLSMFNGHYGQPMYHPLLIFERHTGCLLDVRLRRGNCVSYNRVVRRVRRLLRRLRAQFPGVRIRLRADAGFAHSPLFDLLEQEQVAYAIRLVINPRLRQHTQAVAQQAAALHQVSGQPQQLFHRFSYRMDRWPHSRTVASKVEHSAAETGVYFILTNWAAEAQQVFAFYNGRGECENRIAELKNGFHADRLSCHRFLANAFRLLLHALAYNLVNLFRLHLPQPLRAAQIDTLRQQLFKVGARVRHTARWVWVHLATGWPWQESFCLAAASG